MDTGNDSSTNGYPSYPNHIYEQFISSINQHLIDLNVIVKFPFNLMVQIADLTEKIDERGWLDNSAHTNNRIRFYLPDYTVEGINPNGSAWLTQELSNDDMGRDIFEIAAQFDVPFDSYLNLYLHVLLTFFDQEENLIYLDGIGFSPQDEDLIKGIFVEDNEGNCLKSTILKNRL